MTFAKLVLVLVVSFLPHLSSPLQDSTIAILINSRNGEPIPFATIKVLHTKAWTYSNESGKFSLPQQTNDTLLISSIGYITKKTLLNRKPMDTIYLEPRIEELQQVTIGVRKSAVKKILGITKAKIDLRWGGSGSGEEFAQLIHLPVDGNEQLKVKKVMLSSDNINPTTPAILHIYSVHSISGFPGEELLQNRYLITKQNLKGKKIIIDIEGENLYVNEKSIFVSCEYLGLAESKIKKSGFPTTLLMTYDVPEILTYSRTLLDTGYRWFPFTLSPAGKEISRPTNTMFSIEVELYKQ